MSEDGVQSEPARTRKLPVLAALIALIGVADAGYLTVHHLTAEPVPCSVTGGCETVLTSDYATLGGIPIAAIGAFAYFAAFALSTLAAYGNRNAWKLFGLQATLMAAVSLFLTYLQAYVIGAFCQFCLVSAATSIGMFAVFIVSHLLRADRIR